MPARMLTMPITAFQPRLRISRCEIAVNNSTAPLTVQKMPSSSASASRVIRTCRTAYRPMISDSTPSSASSTRVPPVRSSEANAPANRKMPITTSWMPNSTARTTSVRPGQASAATPTSSVMTPNARTHPQCLPTRATMSAGSALVPAAICMPLCRMSPDRACPMANVLSRTRRSVTSQGLALPGQPPSSQPGAAWPVGCPRVHGMPGRVLMLRVLGQVRVGTASWTDPTLIESGWYPPEADTPEKRLRYYARRFPLVEVDATYYALPAEQTAAAWAARTPAGFTFNVKAFSLFTQHPTRVAALPADLRPAAEKAGKDRVYLKDVDPAIADQAWDRFLAALEPLRQAGKLGAILLQFPPWFPISRARKDYIASCAQRVAPRRVCVEFRNRTWMTPDNQQETLDFLSSHQLPYVCVDMPQGCPGLHPAGAGGDRPRPGRGPPARPLGEMGQQRHPRAVRLPLHRRRASRLGTQGRHPGPRCRGHPRPVQ